MRARLSTMTIAVTAVLFLQPVPAEAIPAFARKYNASCSLCHSTIPRLNTFGEEFAANGFEMVVGEQPRDTLFTGDALLRLLRRIDFAVRMDFYASVSTPVRRDAADVDLQTPYNVKLLSGGVLADRISYYMYFLLSERGEVTGLEDAYIQFTDIAGTGVGAIVGQFQVSDPLFKRELRLQYEDYQPYRVRVGDARADLTYDRGVMLNASPWEGGDVSLMMVNGQGLRAAAENRQYDRDNPKSFAARLSQEFGPLRVGAFGYVGRERIDGITDRISIFGPDATIEVGPLQFNLQYLRREDSNPLFVPGAPSNVVDAAFAEVLWGPFGTDSRWSVAGLYSWIDSEAPLVSLRNGEDSLMGRWHGVSGGIHYLLRRNVRLTGEAGHDLEMSRSRLTFGTVLAF